MEILILGQTDQETALQIVQQAADVSTDQVNITRMFDEGVLTSWLSRRSSAELRYSPFFDGDEDDSRDIFIGYWNIGLAASKADVVFVTTSVEDAISEILGWQTFWRGLTQKTTEGNDQPIVVYESQASQRVA